jgi:hypothetical protein
MTWQFVREESLVNSQTGCRKLSAMIRIYLVHAIGILSQDGGQGLRTIKVKMALNTIVNAEVYMKANE